MSIRLMSDIWKSAKDVKSERLIVLLALADWANDEGLCWPKMETIAEKARTSKDGASRIVAWLEEEGYLTIERGTGRGNNSTYIVHTEPSKGRCIKGDSKLVKGDAETERAILNGIKGDPDESRIYRTRAGLTIIEPPLEPSVHGALADDSKIENIEGPLAQAIKTICKKSIILSPNDSERMKHVLFGLSKENATPEQVAEFGRKCSQHWTGRDKISLKPRAPAISNVLSCWREVLELDEPQAEEEYKTIAELTAEAAQF